MSEQLRLEKFAASLKQQLDDGDKLWITRGQQKILLDFYLDMSFEGIQIFDAPVADVDDKPMRNTDFSGKS